MSNSPKLRGLLLSWNCFVKNLWFQRFCKSHRKTNEGKFSLIKPKGPGLQRCWKKMFLVFFQTTTLRNTRSRLLPKKRLKFAEFVESQRMEATLNLFKSSHRRYFFQKVFLKFHKIHRNICVWSLYFNKVTGLRPATLWKKRLQHRCFPVNFVKFLGTPFNRKPRGNCFSLF